jgi:pimeloyl-ACP methyl ester carboxylesterase
LSWYWTVFALDLRNHGDSPHSPHFGYEALVEDLKWFIDRHRIDQAILLGHSLGGKIVMAFADRFPETVEQLIVVDIAPKPYPAGHRHMLKALIDFDLSRINSLKEAVAGLSPAIPSLAIRQFLVKNLVRGKNGRYRWKINLDAIYRHYKELSQGPRLRNLCPKSAMFIRGKASEFVIDEDVDLIRRYFPHSRIVCRPLASCRCTGENQRCNHRFFANIIDACDACQACPVRMNPTILERVLDFDDRIVTTF